MGTSEWCFGEQPLSFRSLLKRYVQYVRTTATVTGSAHDTISVIRPIIPSHSPAYTSPATRDQFPVLFRSIKYAYLGEKGGMRRKLRCYVEGDTLNYFKSTKVLLQPPESARQADALTLGYNTGGTPNSGLGANVYLPSTNAGVEVELPYYSVNLFHFAFNSTGYGTTDTNEMHQSWMQNYRVNFTSSVVTGTVGYEEDYATAEDYNLMRFNGAPFYTTG